MNQKQQETRALAEQIIRHRQLYERGSPEISDAAFDKLEDRLRKLAPTHAALSAVGLKELSGKKVEHTEPMLSLNKTYDEKDLYSWADDKPVVGSWKVDGVSLSLIYEAGRLTLAKTRGNGRIGEDVTIKAIWVPDILHELTEKISVEVRGELYCPEVGFGRLVVAMEELGLERPTSPRNIVAGLLGRKAQNELMRHFNFFAFEAAGPAAQSQFNTEWDKLNWLGQQGFALPNPKLLGTSAAIAEFLLDVKDHLAESEISLDGAVFVYNDLKTHKDLGVTAHHPRYKMSFKWQGQTAVSLVRRLDWSTSRLGIVTPVAVIDPVFLSGAQLTNITLHNAAHVRDYNVKVGDGIEIVRSGEVIPKFLRVVTPAAGTYTWPQRCPACEAPLAFDEVRLKCPNTAACSAQQMRGILNWIRAAEIDDLSEKRLESLMDFGMVARPADLYRLKREDLLRLPLTKEKMADKLLANIHASRTPQLPRFLMGLGIEGGGITTWEKLLDHFPTLAALRAASEGDIAGVEGFAAKSAGQIVVGLKAKQTEIESLLKAGVTPQMWQARAAPSDSPLFGKTIAITGALSRPRDEIEAMIKAAGAKPATSVSAKTFALVTNDADSGSAKMKKAQELGIPVWSEAALITKLNRPQ